MMNGISSCRGNARFASHVTDTAYHNISRRRFGQLPTFMYNFARRKAGRPAAAATTIVVARAVGPVAAASQTTAFCQF
jgi:hypothetical protein